MGKYCHGCKCTYTLCTVITVHVLRCENLFYIGPAGTGKTESVKALGHQMGRFVLVFNCDETFDFQVSNVHDGRIGLKVEM